MRKIILITTLLLGIGISYANAQSTPRDPSAPLPKEQDKSNPDFPIPDPTRPDTFILDSGPGVIADTMSINIPDTIENKTSTTIDKKSKATPTAPENKPKVKSNKTSKTKTSNTNRTHKTVK